VLLDICADRTIWLTTLPIIGSIKYCSNLFLLRLCDSTVWNRPAHWHQILTVYFTVNRQYYVVTQSWQVLFCLTG